VFYAFLIESQMSRGNGY